jgi:hypothetical protein
MERFFAALTAACEHRVAQAAELARETLLRHVTTPSAS